MKPFVSAQDEEEGGIARGEEWGYAHPSSPLRVKILDLLRMKKGDLG